MMEEYPGRLGFQQRVFPAYRAAFFDLLASHCAGGMSVFAGEALPQEHIVLAGALQTTHYVKARNRHLFDPSSPFYYCWQEGFTRWLESWQPDVLIVESNPRYRSTPGAIRWMHARGRPVLGWGLGAPLLRRLLTKWHSRSRWAFLRTLDGVIAYSRSGAEEYRQIGFAAERVFVAPNAVAPPPSTPPPVRPPAIAGRPTVLFVGRLQERKHVGNLLHACAALPQALQPRLVVVGGGPEGGKLERLASTLYPAAEFTGDLRGPALEEQFLAADLFVLPGTGGLAVQQAMAFALPVIVAEGDGTQDDLVQPKNGWRVPPDDLGALTQALQTALEDASRLRQMGQASFRIVKEQANIEKMVEAFIQALNTITFQAKRST